MGVPRQRNVPMRQLGRTLRELRRQNRLSQKEVAARMRCSKAKISRLELGQLPNYHEFLALLDLYGVITPDYGPYEEMYERAEKKDWWHFYEVDDKEFVSLEADACMEREYQLGYPPGL